ncbi:MAG: hypothetical protein ACTSUE_10365 [Promethearchaeota archaeon]
MTKRPLFIPDCAAVMDGTRSGKMFPDSIKGSKDGCFAAFKFFFPALRHRPDWFLAGISSIG